MADHCTDALHTAAAESVIDPLELYSRASHDTMHIAKSTDAGMLFAHA